MASSDRERCTIYARLCTCAFTVPSKGLSVSPILQADMMPRKLILPLSEGENCVVPSSNGLAAWFCRDFQLAWYGMEGNHVDISQGGLQSSNVGGQYYPKGG